MTPQLFVVNASKRISEHDARAMTAAVRSQAYEAVLPAWGRTVNVRFSEGDHVANPGDWVITLRDDPDEAGVLGWHTDDKGVVYGNVFASPSLDHGSTALDGPYAVSATLSHEVLETLGDPTVNLWADTGHGFLVAYELCDAVEDGSYDVRTRYGMVKVSNFLLPTWFDAEAADQGNNNRYDFMGRLSHPFTMASGGYWVQMADGKVTQQFGRTMPEWRQDLKRKHGRSATKVRKAEYACKAES